ncbi:F-box only protein 42 [Myotis davidii]|uniref:F-box only protein 42 n=1 Tax=Myotis davidii TaxID=225400 RepID=L5LR23_MYODS|nr:F-box only protein 42 [Myotis davidii]
MVASSSLSPAGAARVWQGRACRSMCLPLETPSPLSPPAAQGWPEAQASLVWQLPSCPGLPEAQRGRERERDSNINDERDSLIDCFLHAPYWGSSPQPRHMPLIGIEPATLQSTAVEWNVMASSSDSEDDSFMAVDQEETVLEGTMEQDEEPQPIVEVEETRHNRSMSELPEEVLEYILSFLSPYQEHKTAALVCKQWYRLIKGVAHQCYHGFIKAVQEGNIQWESRTYPYPGTPITQRFSHSACYYDANQSMYVFGGCTQSSCNAAFNDLWRLDLNSKEWIRPLASGVALSCKVELSDFGIFVTCR